MGPMAKTALRLLSVFLPLSSAGCGGTAGAWLYWFGHVPEEKVKAEFKLTKEKLAILIDDDRGGLLDPTLPSMLTENLSKEFVEHNVNQFVIPAREVTQLRRKDSQFDKRGIREIGLRLDATQVLHINVRKFLLHDDVVEPAYKGRFVAAVKVIDVNAKTPEDVRLWPNTSEGKVLEVTTEIATPKDPGYKEQLTRRLCEEMADKIAKLFYDHKVPKPL